MIQEKSHAFWLQDVAARLAEERKVQLHSHVAVAEVEADVLGTAPPRGAHRSIRCTCKTTTVRIPAGGTRRASKGVGSYFCRRSEDCERECVHVVTPQETATNQSSRELLWGNARARVRTAVVCAP
eukprot:2639612-Prymnesium_polylepis.3